jgi:hypothetical protein
MIPALLWKEYREHRTIWLAMAVAEVLGLYGLTQLLTTNGFGPATGSREMLEAVAILLAWAYGLVCGSMLLAGESENATQAFLDILPVRRLQLWWIKGLTGVGLLVLQILVILAAVLALGIAEKATEVAAVLFGMLLAGVLGLAWGLLFSARGEIVLNVIGLAIIGQLAAAALLACVAPLLMLLALFVLFLLSGRQPLRGPEQDFLKGLMVVLSFGLLTVGPVVGSAHLFSRTDRLRGPGGMQAGEPRTSMWASWQRLIWLTFRQMRRLTIGLAVFGVATGFVLPLSGLVAWPILTLLVGVLCGVAVFGDEQLQGSFRYLGDQRLPLGRVWLVKVGLHFALAVAAACLVLFPSLLLAVYHALEDHARSGEHIPFLARMFHSQLVDTVIPGHVFLLMWLLYGFTAGHLFGLLFRKSLVAGVVSLGLSALLAGVWIPSLLGIGLHLWQVAGIPLILLTTGRLLMPAWTANRLAGRDTFLQVGSALALVALCVVGGLWYRVAEVPEVPDVLNIQEFKASLPTFEENTAGRLCHAALLSAEELLNQSGREEMARGPRASYPAQAGEVIEHGWPRGEAELAAWLDRMVRQKWYKDLTEVADYADAHEPPLGVVEDPRRLNQASPLRGTNAARDIAVLLAAHGLKQQARGDDKTFVDNLRIGLALSRNMQYRAPAVVALAGRAMEGIYLQALNRWLEKLKGEPQMLRRALNILRRHEAQLPDGRDQLQAEYLIALNSLDEVPEQMLEEVLMMHGLPRDRGERAQAEIKAAALAWRIPWEEERHRRIVRILFEGDRQQQRLALDLIATPFRFFQPAAERRFARTKRGVARLHAGQLKVALRLYQAANGEPAHSLDVLKPRYLSAIPLDPFDQAPFRYRLSRGERIEWPTDPQQPGMVPPGGPPPADPVTRFVPAGQGILWCVGEDGRDDGGSRHAGDSMGRPSDQQDLIFLVPLPPK